MSTDVQQNSDYTFCAAPQDSNGIRLVTASRAGEVALDLEVDTNDEDCYQQFIRQLEETVGAEEGSLDHLVGDVVTAVTEADHIGQTNRRNNSGGRTATPADQLVELACNAELFHDPEGANFASVTLNGHVETRRIKSRGFQSWLARQYYDLTGKAPSSHAITEALLVINGEAEHAGEEFDVHVRIASGPDGAIYIDLADERWRAVRISEDGWDIVESAPVKFVRSKGLLPLPVPIRGRRIDDLRQFVNVRDDQWPLLVGWLVAAARPAGPYPICVFGGEQGAAKSTATRVLKRLIDPNKADLRSAPRDAHNLAIAASNSLVIALDNLSWIPDWLSDALCRLSTGGGFATRELYSDGDESIFEAKRPVVINGIEDLANRGDLLDRSLLIGLDRISDHNRRTEREFWQAFDQDRPYLTATVYDAISAAMRNLSSVSIAELPRMADFAEWCVAAEPLLGIEEGGFMQSYSGNRASAHSLALEGSHVARYLRLQIGQQSEWRGTATALLSALNGLARHDEVTRQKGWPKTPRVLSGHIRRIAPNLREAGIDVEFHHSGTRQISVRRNSNWESFPITAFERRQP